MKIAVLGTRGFPGVQGGVEVHCENLYRLLAKKGCRVTVFMRSSYKTSQSGSIEGIETVLVPTPKNKYLEAFVHTYQCVWLARKLKPDVVHIHAIGPSVMAPLARVLGMRVVITNHGPDYKRQKWPFLAKLFLMFCEWTGMTFSSANIVIARNIHEDIKKRLHRESIIIPNGVNMPLLAESDEILKKLGLKKDRYLLAVGRLVPEKGFDSLIEAFDKARLLSEKEGSWDWKLVIVGRADFEDRYSLSLKQKAEGKPHVILAGFMTGEPLRELYSHAGLFVLPSFYEGLPIVLLEAMSYRLSCIASDIPANRNIEMDEERFFKPGDSEMLSKKIMRFITRPLSEEEKAKQARMISETYDWKKIADSTLAVYEDVVGRISK